MLPPKSLKAYLPAGFSLTGFRAGTRVADVGCGTGRHLVELQRLGYDAIGVEVDPVRLEKCSSLGVRAVSGSAERLPLEDSSLDGVVCNVVIPYTDEAAAIAEWARVLAPGGEVRAVYHGIGYPVRLLLLGPGLAYRLYGLRTILNTWYYCLTGRRIPGWLGDTVYQARGRLSRYYARHQLLVTEDVAGKSFFGMPVFICHRILKPAATQASV